MISVFCALGQQTGRFQPDTEAFLIADQLWPSRAKGKQGTIIVNPNPIARLESCAGAPNTVLAAFRFFQPDGALDHSVFNAVFGQGREPCQKFTGGCRVASRDGSA